MAESSEIARMVAALFGDQKPALSGNDYVAKNFPVQVPQPLPQPMHVVPPWLQRTRLPMNLR